MDDFVNFIKEQGVVGVAVAFVVGAAAVSMIETIVSALVTPIVTLISGSGSIENAFTVELKEAVAATETSPAVEAVNLQFGNAIDGIIQFLIVAFVVYMMVRTIGADKWDAKK